MPRTKETRNPLGSIFKRKIIKNGKVITVYDARKCYAVIGPDGKKRYKTKTKRCYSHSEAQVALLNLPNSIIEQRKGSASATNDRTFRELAEYFKTEYCKPAVFVRGEHVTGYRQDPKWVKRFVDEFIEFFGDLPLGELTYEHLRTYAVHLATNPIHRPGSTKLPQTSTVNRKLSVLRRILNIGKRMRWIAVNPFEEGEPLIKKKAERSRERVLTYEEEYRLLAACAEPDVVECIWRGRKVKYTTENRRPHLRLVIILAIETAMRKGEIFKLERGMIDLENRVITLPKEITKAWKGRLIAISDRLEKELRNYFNEFGFLPKAKLFFGRKDADKAFATACRRAKIKDFKFHDLRHTALTWMDEAGLSGPVKQNMAGHSDDRTHQDYHNPSIDILDSARAKLNAYRRQRDKANSL
jgi:integrase